MEEDNELLRKENERLILNLEQWEEMEELREELKEIGEENYQCPKAK